MNFEQAIHFWKIGKTIYRKNNPDIKSFGNAFYIYKEDVLLDDWEYEESDARTRKKHAESVNNSIINKLINKQIYNFSRTRKWISRFLMVFPVFTGAFAGWIFGDPLKVLSIGLIVMSFMLLDVAVRCETNK
jgi:hypothetical protein